MPPSINLARYSSGPWNQLLAEFPDDDRLNDIAVFAIPKGLASAIGRLLPAVLSKDDVHFEHRLRELSATGLYFRTPIFSDVMDGLDIETDEFSKDAIVEGKRSTGGSGIPTWFGSQNLTTAALQAEEQLRAESHRHVQRRLKGYAGWLVTCQRFQVDVHQMLERHRPIVERCEAYFTTRVENTEPFTEGSFAAYIGSKQALAERWMLDGMTANLIPEPIRPAYWSEEVAAEPGNEATGATVFIPWSLFADKDLKLSEVLQGQMSRRNLDHIQEWIDGDKTWGYDRLGRVLDLYVYFELAIKRRYADRLIGVQGKLDEAFAVYWEPERADDAIRMVDGISKLRQRLSQGLRSSNRESALAKVNPPERIGTTRFDPDPEN